MSETNKWYLEKGYQDINKSLIELVNQNVGWIDLSNVLDISNFNIYELSGLLSEDGVISIIKNKKLLIKL